MKTPVLSSTMYCAFSKNQPPDLPIFMHPSNVIPIASRLMKVVFFKGGRVLDDLRITHSEKRWNRIEIDE